jgi:hypothetical protein
MLLVEYPRGVRSETVRCCGVMADDELGFNRIALMSHLTP